MTLDIAVMIFLVYRIVYFLGLFVNFSNNTTQQLLLVEFVHFAKSKRTTCIIPLFPLEFEQHRSLSEVGRGRRI